MPNKFPALVFTENGLTYHCTCWQSCHPKYTWQVFRVEINNFSKSYISSITTRLRSSCRCLAFGVIGDLLFKCYSKGCQINDTMSQRDNFNGLFSVLIQALLRLTLWYISLSVNFNFRNRKKSHLAISDEFRRRSIKLNSNPYNLAFAIENVETGALSWWKRIFFSSKSGLTTFSTPLIRFKSTA